MAISFWRITVSRLLRHLKFRATIKHFLSHRRTTYFNYFVVFQAAVISSQLASFQFARSALDSARTALGRGIKSERNARGAVVSPSAAAFSRRAVPRPELSSWAPERTAEIACPGDASRVEGSDAGFSLLLIFYYYYVYHVYCSCCFYYYYYHCHNFYHYLTLMIIIFINSIVYFFAFAYLGFVSMITRINLLCNATNCI